MHVSPSADIIFVFLCLSLLVIAIKDLKNLPFSRFCVDLPCDVCTQVSLKGLRNWEGWGFDTILYILSLISPLIHFPLDMNTNSLQQKLNSIFFTLSCVPSYFPFSLCFQYVYQRWPYGIWSGWSQPPTFPLVQPPPFPVCTYCKCKAWTIIRSLQRNWMLRHSTYSLSACPSFFLPLFVSLFVPHFFWYTMSLFNECIIR